MIIFRWQAHDSKVEIGVSPQRNTNFSHQGREKTFDFWGFHLVWFENARFASTKRSFLTSGCPKKNCFFRFFWSLYNVNNLRTASFSLNATRCRSKSLNSACFHTWRCVSTYRSTPIWTSLDLLLTAISVEGPEVATFSSVSNVVSVAVHVQRKCTWT